MPTLMPFQDANEVVRAGFEVSLGSSLVASTEMGNSLRYQNVCVRNNSPMLIELVALTDEAGDSGDSEARRASQLRRKDFLAALSEALTQNIVKGSPKFAGKHVEVAQYLQGVQNMFPHIPDTIGLAGDNVPGGFYGFSVQFLPVDAPLRNGWKTFNDTVHLQRRSPSALMSNRNISHAFWGDLWGFWAAVFERITNAAFRRAAYQFMPPGCCSLSSYESSKNERALDIPYFVREDGGTKLVVSERAKLLPAWEDEWHSRMWDAIDRFGGGTEVTFSQCGCTEKRSMHRCAHCHGLSALPDTLCFQEAYDVAALRVMYGQEYSDRAFKAMLPEDFTLAVKTLGMEILRQEGLCDDYSIAGADSETAKRTLQMAVDKCFPRLESVEGKEERASCRALVYDRHGVRRFLSNGAEVKKWLEDPAFFLQGEQALGHMPFGCASITVDHVQDMGHAMAKQVELFFTHDIIVLPHGATSVNVLFSRQGTALVEVWPVCDADMGNHQNWRRPHSWLNYGDERRSVRAAKEVRLGAVHSCNGSEPVPTKLVDTPESWEHIPSFTVGYDELQRAVTAALRS